MLTIYGLEKCSTCKKAIAWLEQEGHEFQFVDYRESPIDARLLAEWADGFTWPKVVNRASMTWRNLSEDEKSPQTDADWLSLVDAYPALVRRPVLTRGGEALMFGFKAEKWSDLI